MGFSSRCGICTHPYASVINDMLLRRALGEEGLTYRSIMNKMEELGHPVGESALSRHNSQHFDVSAEGRRRAAEQYEDASEAVAEKTVSDLEFLDSVRDAAAVALEADELRPDIGDAIRAIATKHQTVMKEENPLAAFAEAVAGVCGAEKGEK